MLADTAEAMGIVAAETIADAETIEIDFDMIPRATFCEPDIVRLLRGAGQGEGVRRQGRVVPVYARHAAWPRPPAS